MQLALAQPLARLMRLVYLPIIMTYRIFIDGGAGTTGLQVAGRLADRDDLDIHILPDEARKDTDARKAALETADIAILCLPDEAAIETAALAADLPVRLIDASSAHRVASGWVYGFAELCQSQRQYIAEAKRVSNPGCYPTGFLALVRPLIDAGILSADALLTVPAISGYSGGGKQMIANFEAGTEPPHFAYGLGLGHKHLPEMQRHAGLNTAPIFMPSVGAFAQGMLVHVPLHQNMLKNGTSLDDIINTYDAHFSGQPLIEVCSDWQNSHSRLEADALAGLDKLQIGVFANVDKSQFWATARLDNLGKGAAGAAVQNLNIMLGLNPLTGLAV